MDRTQRVPRALQDVFVASNTGKEVNVPPEKLASAVFFRSWVHKQCRSDPEKTSPAPVRSTLFEESRRKIECFAQNIPESSTRLRGKPKSSHRPSFRERSQCMPQVLLDEQMRSLGYSIDTYHTLHTGYYKSPTELQLASHGPYMTKLVKESNKEGLREALKAGMSPHPCNQYGESLVHMACRRGDCEILNILLEAGASVQVADDYGRTPLHDACWAAKPAFDVIEAILKLDNRLFYMKDCRGSLPLSYVHASHFVDWRIFILKKVIPLYFPSEKATSDIPPELCRVKPNAFPLPSPKDALSLELARLVAQGQLTTEEAIIMKHDDPTASFESESDSGSESCDESDYADPSMTCTEDYDEYFDETAQEIVFLAKAHQSASGDGMVYSPDKENVATVGVSRNARLENQQQNPITTWENEAVDL